MVDELNLTIGQAVLLIWFLVVLLVSMLHLFYRDKGKQSVGIQEESTQQKETPRPSPWVGGSFLR